MLVILGRVLLWLGRVLLWLDRVLLWLNGLLLLLRHDNEWVSDGTISSGKVKNVVMSRPCNGFDEEFRTKGHLYIFESIRFFM